MMKTRITNILKQMLLWVSGAVIVTACTDDNFIGLQPNTVAGTSQFIFQLPKYQVVETRALSEDDENKIDDFFVLAFDTITGSKKLKKIDKILESNRTLITNETNLWKFTLAGVSPAYKYIALANVSVSSYTIDSTTESDVINNLLLDSGSGAWDLTKSIPMCGELINYGADNNKFIMRRMLAKINVCNRATKKFKIYSIRYHNYVTKGFVIPDLTAYNNKKATTWGKSDTDLGKVTGINEKINTNIQKDTLQNQFYVFEAANQGGFPAKKDEENWRENDDAYQKWKKNPCLIVYGKYNNALGYYRIDFVDSNSKEPTDGGNKWLDLLRNHQYNVVIEDVKGPGYSTAGLAYELAPMNMNVTTYPEDLSESDGGEIVMDGPYYLKVSTTDVVIPYDAIVSKSAGAFREYHTGIPIKIQTNYTGAANFTLKAIYESYEGVVTVDKAAQMNYKPNRLDANNINSRHVLEVTPLKFPYYIWLGVEWKENGVWMNGADADGYTYKAPPTPPIPQAKEQVLYIGSFSSREVNVKK